MITPIEIRQHNFKKKLRGYDPEEVSSFLNTLSLEFEKLIESNRRLKHDLEKTQSNLDSLKQVETVLHKTLLQAEETSKATVENARRDAELKVQEAENKSRGLVKSAMDERSKIERDTDELVARRNEILQQLKSYLQAQLDRLGTFESQEMRSSRPEPSRSSSETDNSFFESSVIDDSNPDLINELAEEL